MKRDILSLQTIDHESAVDSALRKRLKRDTAAKERAERVAQRERAERAQLLSNLTQWQIASTQIATEYTLVEPQANPLGSKFCDLIRLKFVLIFKIISCPCNVLYRCSN